MQKVSHQIFTSNYLPYWVSAVMLYGEVLQLLADSQIWDNKKLTPALTYDLTSTADQYMYHWRTWFGQFYEGAAAIEKQQKNKLDW